MWSTGLWKKPCTWPAWRSIVSTLSTPAACEDVGHEAGGDRLARHPLLVLAAVRIPGHDRGDALGGREGGRLHHHQQLDEGVVGRRDARLHDEHVGAADRLLVADIHLAVRERLQRDVAELDAEPLGDCLAQRHVGPAGEEHQALVRRPLHPRRVLTLGHGRGRHARRGEERDRRLEANCGFAFVFHIPRCSFDGHGRRRGRPGGCRR